MLQWPEQTFNSLKETFRVNDERFISHLICVNGRKCFFILIKIKSSELKQVVKAKQITFHIL